MLSFDIPQLTRAFQACTVQKPPLQDGAEFYCGALAALIDTSCAELVAEYAYDEAIVQKIATQIFIKALFCPLLQHPGLKREIRREADVWCRHVTHLDLRRVAFLFRVTLPGMKVDPAPLVKLALIRYFPSVTTIYEPMSVYTECHALPVVRRRAVRAVIGGSQDCRSIPEVPCPKKPGACVTLPPIAFRDIPALLGRAPKVTLLPELLQEAESYTRCTWETMPRNPNAASALSIHEVTPKGAVLQFYQDIPRENKKPSWAVPTRV